MRETTLAIVAFTVVIAVILGGYYAFSKTLQPSGNEFKLSSGIPPVGIYKVVGDSLVITSLKKEPSENAAIVGIFSQTCPHCNNFWPIFSDVIQKYINEYDISVYVLSVQPGFTGDVKDLAIYYYEKGYWEGSVPAVLIFKNGSLIDKKVGEMSSFEFEQLLNELIER
jgi:thiol-disulfide isomerase/thioredoxin